MKKQLLCFLATNLILAFTNMEVVSAQTNTATGFEALFSITTGTNNTATGCQAMRLNSTGFANTAHGFQALFSNNGGFNSAFGAGALLRNTTGNRNTACGTQALVSNTTGSNNTANGAEALFSNTTGYSNTANGAEALRSNTTGFYNSANGAGALLSNITGSNNSALGYQALYLNTTSNSNTATGYQSLYSNTTADNNTANGYRSLYSNTIGTRNTAAGYQALYSNVGGQHNTAYGNEALYSNLNGENNAAYGSQSLYSNSLGFRNVAAGYQAMYNNTSGYGNTVAGWVALGSNTTGIGNVALGYYAGATTNQDINTFIGALSNASGVVYNSTALGFEAVVTASNQVRLGNTNVSSIGGQVNWTAFSDGRYKKNMQEDVPGLSFITKLRPVTYTLDVSNIDAKLKASRSKSSDEKGDIFQELSDQQQKSKQQKSETIYTGFVAQEVEKIAKDINYNFSGIDKPQGADDFYGLRYGDFVVPLVKAVQELSEKNHALEQEVNELKKFEQEVEDLKKLVANLTAQKTNSSGTVTPISGAYLKQNIPNPHKGSTTIPYYVPQGAGIAKVVLTSAKGQVLKSLAINGLGEGQITIYVGTLPAGSYNYSLWIDGRQVDSKQMLIVK
jgi:hypothetical protein